MKTKRRKKRKRLKRSLLHLLNKINTQLQYLEALLGPSHFTLQYRHRRSAIGLVYEQQSEMFEQGVNKLNDYGLEVHRF